MKKILILASLLISGSLLAQSVRLNPDVDLVVRGNTNGSLSLNVEESSGDSTSSSAPSKVYVPVLNTALVANNSVYYMYSNGGNPSVFDVTQDSHVVNLPLRISTPVNDTYYLHAAVQNPSDTSKYLYIQTLSGALSSSLSNSDLTFGLKPRALCTALPTDCQNLLPTSTSKIDKQFLVYFFLSTESSYGSGDEIAVTDTAYSHGIYFQVGLSNRFLQDSDLRITINNVRVGDKRLILKYSASSSVTSSIAKATKAFIHSGAPGATNAPIGSGYSGTVFEHDFPYVRESEITVNNLTNGTAATISVFFVDKYLMATTLSEAVTETPLEIEELLKKEGCFLLTAGFGEEHFVIDYFRGFRDHVLKGTYFGERFINFYYELAPKHAYALYQSEELRWFVRAGAYVLYFIFNNFFLLCGLGIIGLSYAKRHKKENLILR